MSVELSTNWKTVQFDTVAELKHGYQFRTPDFIKEGVKVFKITQIQSDGSINIEKCNFIAYERLDNFLKFRLKNNDILMALTGATIGKIARYNSREIALQNYRVGNFIPLDEAILNKDYFYYFLSSKHFFHQILARQTQSAQQNIGKDEINKMTVILPNIESQIIIAKTLKSLDDKIELNRKMNKTLEAMAQAIFKSWFVDFDPVHAKANAIANGQDSEAVIQAAMEAIAGSNPEINSTLGADPEKLRHIASLFSSEFIESDLGLIPKGWEVKPLYETANYINGAAFKSKDFSSDGTGLPIVKIAELKQGVSSQTKFTTGEFKPRNKIVNGDILYSWSGSPETSLEVFKWFGGNGWLNQHIFKIEIGPDHSKLFVYCLLRHMKPVLIQTAKDKQTTGLGHITVADMKRLGVAYPNKNLLTEFERVIKPFYDQDSNLKIEIQSLSKLRDTLLPKLLSGELSVENAESEMALI